MYSRESQFYLFKPLASTLIFGIIGNEKHKAKCQYNCGIIGKFFCYKYSILYMLYKLKE